MTDMSKRKVILDTDPGVDDVLAILMALASPEIDVTLISIVFGNTHAPVAHANLLKIYHMLAQEIAAIPTTAARYQRLQGQEKTILAMGENAPIDGDKAVAAYFVSFLTAFKNLQYLTYSFSTAWTGSRTSRKRILILLRQTV